MTIFYNRKIPKAKHTPTVPTYKTIFLICQTSWNQKKKQNKKNIDCYTYFFFLKYMGHSGRGRTLLLYMSFTYETENNTLFTLISRFNWSLEMFKSNSHFLCKYFKYNPTSCSLNVPECTFIKVHICLLICH